MGGVGPQDEDEDEAWRAIVENYGERPLLDVEPPASGAAMSGSASDSDEDGGSEGGVDTVPTGPTEDRGLGAEPARPEPPTGPQPGAPSAVPSERFIPPPPPPLPRPRGPRGFAWSAVLGTPLLLIVLLMTGVYVPQFAAWSLAAAFIAGFGYLVWTMPHGPRDPFDDGARV